MWRRRLKPMRVAVALAVMGGLTAALVDFRGAVPAAVGHALASVQLVPATMAALTGASSVAVVLVGLIIAVTLLGGRVYCSVICPLGILQDAVARIVLWRSRGLRRLFYARPQNSLRYGFFGLTVLGIAAGSGGLTLALLDPYSHYGRIAAVLFRPLLVLLNNALVGAGEWLGLLKIFQNSGKPNLTWSSPTMS